MSELPVAKHIDTNFYKLTGPQAKKLSIDGILPRPGWEKRSKPLEQMLKLIRFQHYSTGFWRDYVPRCRQGWISETKLSWFDGEEVPGGFTYAIHLDSIPEYNFTPFKAYPPKPESAELYQRVDYGYEKPTQLGEWSWSTTFGRWGRLVTFADGWHGYTYPKT